MRRLALLCAAVLAVTLAPMPAQADAPPEAAVVGDSYAAGWTGVSQDQRDAWWNYTLRDLGWRQGNIVADPGGGFVQRGDFGTLGDALAAHPIPASTDYVLVQGGLNDDRYDPSLVPAGVARVLDLIHQQAPHAVPIVVGMFIPGPQGATPNRIQVARAIGDYRAIGATRYMIAAMATFELGPDGSHPTAAGHHEIGDWVAWHAAHNLGGSGEPLVQTSGGWYVAQ